jgi:hypothetical protein
MRLPTPSVGGPGGAALTKATNPRCVGLKTKNWTQYGHPEVPGFVLGAINADIARNGISWAGMRPPRRGLRCLPPHVSPCSPPCSSSPKQMPLPSAPHMSKRASCRPPSRCAGYSLASPTTPRRGQHAPGPSPAGNRCPRRLVRSPRHAFVGAGLGRRSADRTHEWPGWRLPTRSKDSPYASDPGRRPAAAIRAGWVRFVQQQQPAPAREQHNHRRAAGNDARPLLSGFRFNIRRRWLPRSG